MATKTPQPNGELYPTYPGRDNSRYKSFKRSQFGCFTIEAGAHSSPAYLPPQWSAHVQPEGKTYFYYDGPLAAVTESWMYASEVATETEKWIHYLSSKIADKGIALESLELCVRYDEDKDCLYYIVDKQNRTLFWIQELNNEELGLFNIASPSHLKMALEAQFWQHIDRFPAHFGGLPEADLLKVLDIYTHTRMDQITSATSTFAFAPADTEALYNLLKDCKGRTSQPEVVSTIARAWNNILHSRFYNQYGEETPRLDSSMSIMTDQEEEREGFSLRIMAFLTFGKSEKNRAQLNNLFVDRHVFFHRVHHFIEKAVKEWKEIPVHAFSMLLLHSAFFFFIASQALAAISAACLSASLLTSFALVHQHDDMMEHENSPIALDWISDRKSTKYNFQRLAFAFALPKAFFNWGLVFFFSHWLWIGLSCLSTNAAATFMGVVVLACIAFTLVTSPKTLQFTLPNFLRRTAESDKSMV